MGKICKILKISPLKYIQHDRLTSLHLLSLQKSLNEIVNSWHDFEEVLNLFKIDILYNNTNMPSFLFWGGLSFDCTSAVFWGVQTYGFFIITGGWLRLLSLWILELVKTCGSSLVAIPTCYMPDHNNYLLHFTLLLLCVCVQWKYWLHVTIHPQYRE